MEREELQNLLYLVQKGNQKAQTRLINFFWEDVFCFVLNKVNDKQVAHELTIVIFTKILYKIHLYDENFLFKSWILAIARNYTIDYWRKKTKDEKNIVTDLESVGNKFEISPEELLISKQNQLLLFNTIKSMNASHRTILEMRFLEEKSIKEISEELGISISSAKIRIMRSKKILHNLLKKLHFTGNE